MKRFIVLIVLFSLLTIGGHASAERLEVNFAVTPTMLQDTGYEAFSQDDLNAFRAGMDLRSEIVSFGGFKLIPVVGYRFATDTGSPYNIVNTELFCHDFAAGLRLRKGILSWLSVFVEAKGGLFLAKMDASQTEDYTVHYSDLGSRKGYKDTQYTWLAEGIAGVELQISKSWLRSRGVHKFGFGGEFGAGYIRRGDISFKPEIEGGIDNAIKAETRPWGEVNLSGWLIQVGVAFKFF